MGGGTGTGAAPVIADIAKQLGILTVAVVTKPFDFEGTRRMRQAQAGIENLKNYVDSLIVILNDKLEEEVGSAATMLDCFAAADDVLYKACNGIAEIIQTPGLINVDFEDLRTVMSERGTAMMGTATASGADRARVAAEKAIACPLLEGANLQGARGLLVYVTASAESMNQGEVRQVMSIMKNFVGKDAIQIIGTAFDNSMGDDLRVTVVATGLDRPQVDIENGGQGQGVVPPVVIPQKLTDDGLPNLNDPVVVPRAEPEPVAEPAPAPKAVPVAPPILGDRQYAPTSVQPAQAKPVEPQVAAPQAKQPQVSVWGGSISNPSGGPTVMTIPTFVRTKPLGK